MNLNCLSCQVLERTNSDGREIDLGAEEHSYEKLLRSKQARKRIWSGNLAPMVALPLSKNSNFVPTSKKVSKLGHRRLRSTGALGFEANAEPRLLRSSGMRRDWSFERDDKNKHYNLSGDRYTDRSL